MMSLFEKIKSVIQKWIDDGGIGCSVNYDYVPISDEITTELAEAIMREVFKYTDADTEAL